MVTYHFYGHMKKAGVGIREIVEISFPNWGNYILILEEILGEVEVSEVIYSDEEEKINPGKYEQVVLHIESVFEEAKNMAEAIELLKKYAKKETE